MTLERGRRLGPYEIESQAGAGGMGEVYRGRDLRLERPVAIKVLPIKTARDPEMRARFEREARVISKLNHPSICTLYDVGHEDDIDFLVMEFLEGETLAESLRRGPVDTARAMEIGILIADGLDAAHRQGLVHRDLKPSNVFLTHDAAKLLDFGLAKLQEASELVEGTEGETRTTPLTGSGTIVGTIQYMSPEQLEGREADARSDIFAFGAVLYEMITGRRAFEGTSHASLIAAIMERDPTPLSLILPAAPPALDRLIRKCLAKDPAERWQSAKDLRDELAWIAGSGSEAGVPAPISARRRFRFRLAWAVAVLAVIGAGVFATLWLTHPSPEARLRRFTIAPGGDLRSMRWPCISPDGQYLAFLASDSAGQSTIWIRPMNSLEAKPLPGTKNANRPFWSPDSRYLAFTVDRRVLKKVLVSGGPVQVIGEVPNIADGCWGSGDVILLDGGPSDSIRQIPALGGAWTAATRIDREAGERSHAWPQFLPDGRHFFFLASKSIQMVSGNEMLKIGSLDSDETTTLFPVDSRVQYVRPGYIIYMQEGVLLAQPFDDRKLQIAGEPFPVAEEVALGGSESPTHFSASNEGTLVYLQAPTDRESDLIWVDRQGQDIDTVGTPAIYEDISISPDGSMLAYALLDSEHDTYDLWVRDLQRDISSRLTFDPLNEGLPLWTPDNSYIIYTSYALPLATPMRKAADGTGSAELLFGGGEDSTFAFDISRDGRTLCCGFILLSEIQMDLELREIDRPEESRLVCSSPFPEVGGVLSPDSRFLAYASGESGVVEVYVLQLDGSGGKWQISSGGGTYPKWSPDGSELFYYSSDEFIVAVPVDLGDSFKAGAAEKLFERRLASREFGMMPYDVAGDDKRFLLNVRREQTHSSFIVVQDWYEERHGAR